MSTFPTKEKALGMYKKMYTIRKYEESIYYLFLEGIMPGSIHQSTGEEASAVGMLYDLGKDDWDGRRRTVPPVTTSPRACPSRA